MKIWRERIEKTLNWIIRQDEPLLLYARNIALLWMERELKHKRKVKGGPLNKACGILAEEIFDAMLNELSVPHVRTLPLLDKSHKVNKGKPYDSKIRDLSIDVKALPPTAMHNNINVNEDEVKNRGWCDIYIQFRCAGDFTPEEVKEMKALNDELSKLYEQGKSCTQEFKEKMVRLKSYIERINQVNFAGWCVKEDFTYHQEGEYGPYYSAKPRLSLNELADKLSIPIERSLIKQFTQKTLFS